MIRLHLLLLPGEYSPNSLLLASSPDIIPTSKKCCDWASQCVSKNCSQIQPTFFFCLTLCPSTVPAKPSDAVLLHCFLILFANFHSWELPHYGSIWPPHENELTSSWILYPGGDLGLCGIPKVQQRPGANQEPMPSQLKHVLVPHGQAIFWLFFCEQSSWSS